MRNTILVGDVLDRLKELPDDYVQCVVTSPPYWGLRNYGVEGQHGLEPTIEEYVAKQVAVFCEVRRVLRPDGVCFVNLGDSYNGSGKGAWDRDDVQKEVYVPPSGTPATREPTLKPKDLCGIPWRVALALQADGWWLRSDIVWAKPNPMPESVTDRPTRSHEYIFLLTKSARYFWDQEAVREGLADCTIDRLQYGRTDASKWKDVPTNGSDMRSTDGARANLSGRNIRSVWTIPTFAFSAAHFATFPPEIPRRCILAGTPIKCCGVCGAPWGRVVERKIATSNPCPKTQAAHEMRGGTGIPSGTVGKSGSGRIEGYCCTLGFRPTCTHNDDTGRSIVLDPYMGSGTTGLVARELGRDYIGIELNPEYADMAERRIRGEFTTEFETRTAMERAGQGSLL